jgi:hypothetical protein
MAFHLMKQGHGRIVAIATVWAIVSAYVILQRRAIRMMN